MDQTRRVLVYGTGAVGAFLGGVLAAAGERVVLVGRPRVVGPIGEAGLRVRVGGGAERRVRPAVAASLAEAAAAHGRPDLVLIGMKAFGTAGAAQEITRPGLWPGGTAGRGGEPPPVLTVQNGVGNEEILAAHLGPERVLSGALTLAVSMPEPGLVAAHNDRGGLALAPFRLPGDRGPSKVAAGAARAADLLEPLAAAFRAGGLRVVLAGAHPGIKWSKLLLNLLANATCAILDQPPAEALADRRVFIIERDAYREAAAVMAASDIPLTDLPGYPVRLLTNIIQWLPAPLAHRLLYPRIAGGRGDKLPSFLLDLRGGKGMTEVVFLNGAVSRQGRDCGVPTPVNDAITEVLEGIAVGAVPWDRFRGRPDRLSEAVQAARWRCGA